LTVDRCSGIDARAAPVEVVMRRVVLRRLPTWPAVAAALLLASLMLRLAADRQTGSLELPHGESQPVQRAIDGDTLLLASGHRVRLIGVDTPETKHPDRPPEPFGEEAAEFTRRMTEGRMVRLEFDRERIDVYRRLLAYVYVDDLLLNEELIRAGLSPAKTGFNYRGDMQRRFRRAEEQARQSGRGLWSTAATSTAPGSTAAPATHTASAPHAAALIAAAAPSKAASAPSVDSDPVAPSPPRVDAWRTVEDLPGPLAQLPTVFWEPDDTASLRKLIRETDLARGRRVLEIGTGTGLIALCCLQAGAARVVATDINRQAIANTAFNAAALGLDGRLELRLVDANSPEAYSRLAPEERFDLIISNPPWENRRPQTIAEHALYDENFRLLRSLIAGLRERLTPGGRAYLAYGCVEAIRLVLQTAEAEGLEVQILDDRRLDQLDEVFLPGMLLELRVPEATAPDR